ncbi:hypothetical protein KUV85_17325 [Nocardioides panacisoli]|uniref:hypothetical protein n=1 Tax=Nocardioides panacisoli TaxID=627624 RepID=UPI001C626B61|nr:hypothetical protein [Nocardioides panacisoli]QYJ04061.1 hypothetical protein KUV85_17325 [Nocardioides panacisoli]
MSDGPTPEFPPPGATPPPEPSGTSYGAAGHPPPPAYAPPPPGGPPRTYGEMLGAAHKPGAIPLRPLTLGAIYDGAFRIIRFNPKATVGAAVLVTAIANLIPVLVTAAMTFALSVPFEGVMTEDPETLDEISTADVAGLVALVSSLFLGAVATWFGMVFVTGMVAHVARAAAVGRRLSLGEAWRATRGKRWRLVGLNVVLSLGLLVGFTAYALLWVVLVVAGTDPLLLLGFGLVSVPALLVALFWFWIRVYYLPVPALMLEDVGVFGAIGRGYRLTSRQFWRTFGIALLTWLLTTIAGQVLSTPVSLVGQLLALAVPEYGWLVLVLTNSLAYVLLYAFVAPFTSAVVALQYLDQRMRKEAHDVELMRDAGLMPR